MQVVGPHVESGDLLTHYLPTSAGPRLTRGDPAASPGSDAWRDGRVPGAAFG